MESGIISQQNTVYVLNTSYGSSDMVNFFLTPAAIKADVGKIREKDASTKIPQPVAELHKETFNDRTRKSLLKLNLFIKRLKWFNIFNDVTTQKPQETTEINSKCNKFLNTKKTLSTKEMYREAAKLLGIDCSLSSSCRCYDCQSHYFDYDESTEAMDETESEDEDSESDTDSLSSDCNDGDQYITNCYLIHTKELCECCQGQNERNHSPSTPPFNGIADLSFNSSFLS